MTISDETLMAFADGELEGAARTAVESAMREDPEIEKRVARHRALRGRISMAYSSELSERVPDRLVSAAMAGAAAPRDNVIRLEDAAKSRQARSRPGHESSPSSRGPAWAWAASIAASVVVGLGLGFFASRQGELALLRSESGALVAHGELARALSEQLAAQQSPNAAVRIGVSFLAKSGDYCRSFVLSGSLPQSGLACRHGADWLIHSLVQGPEGGTAAADYRTAASPMAAAIFRSVDELIVGEPLDGAAEAAARANQWQNASHHAP